MFIKAIEYKNKPLEEFYSNCIKKTAEFFELSRYDKPQLIFLENRKVIDTFFGHKTEDWVDGGSNNGIIGLLLPENYEKYCSHRYSEENYKKLIAHEVCHYFQDRLVNTYKPMWLGEGLAVYLSGQYLDKPVPTEFRNFLKYHDTLDNNIYAEPGLAIKLLVDNFGKSKLLQFIRSFNENNTEKYAKESFERIYDMPLSYSTFNNLLVDS